MTRDGRPKVPGSMLVPADGLDAGDSRENPSGMCITDAPSVESETGDAQMLPTEQAYGELLLAYDCFNALLFDGELPPCLITLQRKSHRVYGYYSSNRFRSNKQHDLATDEIAMNPVHFRSRDIIEVLQTLAHEMVHLWQHHFGNPSRSGYHNREWATKMMAIGLHPSSTGKPGGKIVGQHMADYLIEGGKLARAITALVSCGFTISWYDRIGDGIEPAPQDTGVEPPQSASGVRVKYSCPRCGLNAWAKRGAELICATCQLRMTARPTVWSGVSPNPERNAAHYSCAETPARWRRASNLDPTLLIRLQAPSA